MQLKGRLSRWQEVLHHPQLVNATPCRECDALAVRVNTHAVAPAEVRFCDLPRLAAIHCYLPELDGPEVPLEGEQNGFAVSRPGKFAELACGLVPAEQFGSLTAPRGDDHD